MAERIPTEEVERLVGFHRPVGALAADLLDARREAARYREALDWVAQYRLEWETPAPDLMLRASIRQSMFDAEAALSGEET